MAFNFTVYDGPWTINWTPPEIYKMDNIGKIKAFDMLGTEIEVGDYIIYPAAGTSASEMRFGRVAKITWKETTSHDRARGINVRCEIPKLGVWAIERNWKCFEAKTPTESILDFNPDGDSSFERRPNMAMDSKRIITIEKPQYYLVVTNHPKVVSMKEQIDAFFPVVNKK